jgi:fatty-acyl-CoA synthase
VPDDVVFVSQLPTILSGKVQKNILKEWAVNGTPDENRMFFNNTTLYDMAKGA